MKNLFKKSLILAVLAILALPVLATTVTVDNIKYSITSAGAIVIDGSACSGTVTIHDSVSYTYPGGTARYKIIEIGDSAFMNNSKITRANLYSKFLTRIGKHAFDGCSAMTYVGSVTNNAGKVIDDYAFAHCSSLASIFTGASKLGKFVFNGCTNLLMASISGTVTSIGAGDFLYCKNLKVINLPENLDSIETAAFFGCDSLMYMQFPTTLTFIGNSAFYKCVTLRTICLPYQFKHLGSGAFDGCTALTSIYNMSNEVITLADDPFNGTNKDNITLYVKQGLATKYNIDYWKELGAIYEMDGSSDSDLNSDGVVDVTDITALIKLILG